jgi:hypothetical protein
MFSKQSFMKDGSLSAHMHCTYVNTYNGAILKMASERLALTLTNPLLVAPVKQ